MIRVSFFIPDCAAQIELAFWKFPISLSYVSLKISWKVPIYPVKNWVRLYYLAKSFPKLGGKLRLSLRLIPILRRLVGT